MSKTGSFSRTPRLRNPVARALRGRARFRRHVASNGKRYPRRSKHGRRVLETDK